MKGFASGVGGVCICMLAIMGTILCGFALGAEERATTTTEYTYTADTTGLFDVSEAKRFTDYEPAANWTGFKASATSSGLGGITYATSAKINSYPIPQAEQEGTRTYWVSLATTTGNAEPPGNASTITGYVAIEDGLNADKVVYWPRVVTVQQYYDSKEISTQSIYEFSLINSAGVRVWAAPQSAWELISTQNPIPAWGYVNCYILPMTEYSKVVTLRVNQVQDLCWGLDADGNEIFKGSLSSTTLAYQQETQVAGVYPATTWSGFSSNEPVPGYTISYVTYDPTGSQAYMDVSQGVVPDTTTGSAYWSNGYQNGRIDMLIRWNANASSASTYLNLTLPVAVTTASGTASKDLSVTVQYSKVQGNANGITITGSGGSSSTSKNYAGTFSKGILLSMDLFNDTLEAYAMDSFSTFQDYTLLANPIMSLSGYFSGLAGISGIEPGGMTVSYMTLGVKTGLTMWAPTIGIVGTSVYMGDKTIVMADPTIQPLNLWPGYDPWELRLYSFAIVGDTVSLKAGSSTLASYPVSDGKITVDGKQHTLSNLWIRAEWDATAKEWIVSFVFGDETPQKAIEVATTSDNAGPTITLGGYWYFTSAYYSGKEVTTSSYDFDNQHFIFDSNAAILAYMGLLIMGTIVAKRMGGLGVYDAIILVFAGVCGFVLMM